MQTTPKNIALCQQIAKCVHCQTNLPLPPKPIVQLSAQAKILIIGQAPGLQAHKHNKAFADASGKRLREWLAVTEEQFYQAENFAIMPMAFCYPVNKLMAQAIKHHSKRVRPCGIKRL